ncbi:hypothetical protein [Nocardia gipuzkoensis]
MPGPSHIGRKLGAGSLLWRVLVAGALVPISMSIAATTGNDPELDTLLLRLHTETGCRRGGALGLRPQDLDPVQSLILLREKGGTQLWQPVSPTLMRSLCRHGEQRGAAPNEPSLAINATTPKQPCCHVQHRPLRPPCPRHRRNLRLANGFQARRSSVTL